MIGEALMAKEAKARGIAVERSSRRRWREGAASDRKAVDTVYEQYKAQLRGQTREQAGPRSRGSCASATAGSAARPSVASFSTRPG